MLQGSLLNDHFILWLRAYTMFQKTGPTGLTSWTVDQQHLLPKPFLEIEIPSGANKPPKTAIKPLKHTNQAIQKVADSLTN